MPNYERTSPLWQNFLGGFQTLIAKQQVKRPKIFISYAWEGDTNAT